jgi:hypothetical protein
MVVRVRVRLVAWPGDIINRELASVSAALLTPIAAMALVLGCWRIGADLKWTGEFAISAGLFSHWQVWIVAACLLQISASFLNRLARASRKRRQKAEQLTPSAERDRVPF